MAVNNVRVVAKTKRGKRVEARIEMPTMEELRAIIAATPDRHRPLILTALLAGLRASELRGLLWEDVDLKHGKIHVRRRVDRFNKFGAPKSEAGTRTIPMSPLLANTLRQWRLVCPKGELGLVFPNGAGKVENHGNLPLASLLADSDCRRRHRASRRSARRQILLARLAPCLRGALDRTGVWP